MQTYKFYMFYTFYKFFLLLLLWYIYIYTVRTYVNEYCFSLFALTHTLRV